jgi:hypothetical protein
MSLSGNVFEEKANINKHIWFGIDDGSELDFKE